MPAKVISDNTVDNLTISNNYGEDSRQSAIIQGRIDDNQQPYWEIADNQQPFLEIADYQQPYWEIADNQLPYWEIVDNQHPFWEIATF